MFCCFICLIALKTRVFVMTIKKASSTMIIDKQYFCSLIKYTSVIVAESQIVFFISVAFEIFRLEILVGVIFPAPCLILFLYV